LSERLYQHNQHEQSDIDSLQEILDSPLFNTIYNLQESFQQLKSEFEKGNHLVRNCLFDFDIEGHLKLINEEITKQSISISIEFCIISNWIYLDIKNNRRLAKHNIVRKVILNKQTPNESLGFNIIECKHHLYDINGIFIQNIQANSLADL